jgi:hypothetical protein
MGQFVAAKQQKLGAVQPIVKACPASTRGAAGHVQQPEPGNHLAVLYKLWISEIGEGELCEYLVLVRPANLW